MPSVVLNHYFGDMKTLLLRVWTNFSVSFMERNALTFMGNIPISIMGIISVAFMGSIVLKGYGNTLHKIHDNAESARAHPLFPTALPREGKQHPPLREMDS